MKPNQDTVKHKGQLPGERYQMDFAQTDEARIHLMRMMTDLYQDRPRACIREYSTNAWDSQLQAGVTRPIEVTTPTPLDPFLRIRDFGVGLDREGIADVYSKYGASTKRTSNEFNGMLGLGCKSALSYTAQFTVVGVKDGIKTMVAISRNETGGSMTVVAEQPTTDPSGVEVTIPTKPSDAQTFKTTAADFFRYWKPGMILLDCSEPEFVQTERITDRVHIETYDQGYQYYQNQGERDRIVMGGVAYPTHIDVALPQGNRFVCYVGMGEVGFVPSREALDDFSRTTTTLKAIAKEYADHVNAAAQADIDAQPNHGKAVCKQVAWKKQIHQSIQRPYTYKGQTIPDNLWDGTEVRTTGPSGHSNLGSSRTTSRGVYTSLAVKSIIVTGFSLNGFTANHKRKLLMWCTANLSVTDAAEVKQFVLVEAGSAPKWISKKYVAKWDDVAAIQLPTDPSAPGGFGTPRRLTGSYDGVLPDATTKTQIPAADLAKYKTIVWIHGNKFKGRTHRDRLVSAGVNGYDIIVCLPQNRIDKFKRDFPSAERLAEHVNAQFDSYVRGLTADQRTAYALHQGGALRDIAPLDASKVSDPAIKRASKFCKLDVVNIEQKLKGFCYLGKQAPSFAAAVNPMKPYPLFDQRTFKAHPEHVYAYLNDSYNNRKGGRR